MKVLGRLILFLLVLGLLACLAGALAMVVAVPWLSDFVAGMVKSYPWLAQAFAIGLLGFGAACVLALVLIVSVPGKRHVFVMPKEGGNIEISRRSIEAAAGCALDAMPEVKRYRVEARGDLRPGKVKLLAQVEPRGGEARLADLGNAVQERLQSELAACLNIEPARVRVKLQPMHAKEDTARRTKVPRVV